MSDLSAPIEIDFTKALSSDTASAVTLRTFTSYTFDRSLLTPASAFRFTSPGVNKSDRTQIRSGDIATLFVVNKDGDKRAIATGIIDETDTHVIPSNVEYVLTGRDMIGQLVDNTAVDASNKIINTQQVNLKTIAEFLIANTRIPAGIITQQIPNGTFLFQTNPGETKINSLQRYLELSNCLVWCKENGQLIVGKPSFTQPASGALTLLYSDPRGNNLLEARVKRNVNGAIRKIVAQLQSLDQVDAATYTKLNNDPDMQAVADGLVGRSVYNRFSYGSGTDLVNQVTQVGNQTGNPRKIGDELALREIARENMKILDVEAVVEGHINEIGLPYNVDQVYNVRIEDDDVDEDMLVYNVSYELTSEHGKLTRMRLCRLGTIVAYADALARSS